MQGKRPHAIYCSRRCKTRASDQRRKLDGRSKDRDRKRYEHEAVHRRAYARDQSRRLRDAVLEHFGRTCVECAAMDGLELDHLHGNGERHRDLVGHGDAFYRWLIKNGFPPECASGGEYELQVLCFDCHLAKTRSERARRAREGG